MNMTALSVMICIAIMLAMVLFCFTCFKIVPILKRKFKAKSEKENSQSDDKHVETERKPLKTTAIKDEHWSFSSILWDFSSHSNNLQTFTVFVIDSKRKYWKKTGMSTQRPTDKKSDSVIGSMTE